ncbi:hypothetical protein LHYA1_G004816 [Lachnellula hyalina]|uniref:Uncharacterized protein n=1 Tax=Lachnellula hyalina TaxID=1316788 RepID=A0A8H8R336_9HELO|nr:uncharacterized protein LHYA1_G004816 [Lachnellula hyalina]TVY26825.1 hypothetical protein LHYA1_G004816 [Lachnellula hyalina]
MTSTQPLGPFKLVTVNTAPERAKRLIGRLVEALKEKYTILHVANVQEIGDVKPTVEKYQPDMLFCASMWTPAQSSEIQSIARSIIPGIKTMAIPQGLQVEKGPDAIVEFLLEKVPLLIESPGTAAFRQYLPDLNTPRFQTAKDQDAYQYVEHFQKTKSPPWIYGLTKAWEKLLEEPYKGVTTDGNIIPNLFHVQDEGIPIDKIVTSVENVLNQLTPSQQTKLSYPLNAREWRAWSNPEFLLRPLGLRLEEQPASISTSILAVLKATFSPAGYQKALSAMRINHFLGQLCNIPKVLNELSYNFLLFGEPSTTKPWGWALYGHHLCLSVFLQGPQIFISPAFTGAEPNIIDEGPFAGTRILHKEEALGLKLMQSLPAESQMKARTYELLKDPAMALTGDLAADRWNQDDQRITCGAFRDNRIVPYEGILISELTSIAQKLVLDIVEQFLLYLPDGARKLRLEQVEGLFGETYFSWIGGFGASDAFYYRVQSPVVVVEFDHHSGVFLSNQEPARFHTHTVLRMPNQGDYGCAVRKGEDMVP